MSLTPEKRSALVRALAGVTFDLDSFHRSLGNFVSRFSDTEVNLQIALWQLAGLERRVAVSLLSGLRIDGASSVLSRLADAQKWPKVKRDALDAIKAHLGPITRLRNDILHYGAQAAGPDEWLVSNVVFAHVENRVSEMRITPSLLDDASADLEKIDAHLMMLAWKDVLPAPALEAFGERMKRAWRYKPPTLKGRQSKTRDKPPKRKRPRSPSRKSVSR
jgi:hypothetical protein